MLGTAIDVVDASIGALLVRRSLRRETTTARQRRIDRRQALELAEIERRIGAVAGTRDAGDPPAAPMPRWAMSGAVRRGPSRLVVSGSPDRDRPALHAPVPVAVAVADPGSDQQPALRPDPRGRLILDGAIGVVGIALVVVALGALVDLPAGGASRPTGGVLAAGATPAAPAIGWPAGAGTTGAPVRPAAAPPAAAPPAAAPPAIGPIVTAPEVRLGGATAGGATVEVRLGWDLAAGSVPAAAFTMERRVDDGPFEALATVSGAAREAQAVVPVGEATTFRIFATDPEGRRSIATEWPPITPGRHQETSRLVARTGAWRSAGGPSLSGGTVRYTTDDSATLTLTFRGTDVGWVATRTPMSGRAEVRVDGVLRETVDLASPSVHYRRLAFRHHLSGAGTHVLEIRPIGGGRVDVDAFIVLR